jgi:hydrogenase maturation protease
MKTLILGLGNELYGDDGVGLEVIRQMESHPHLKKLRQKHPISLEASNLTGLKLLDIIAGYDVLIIIDTIKTSQPATGKIRLLEGSDLRHIPGPSPHYVSIPQMIDLGQQIGLKMPQIIKIIAVEAKNIYYLGEGLSPEMKASVPRIIQTLTQVLAEVLP